MHFQGRGVLLSCVLVSLAASVSADDVSTKEAPPPEAASAESPNVVLGRELVRVTNQRQVQASLLQQLLQLQGELANRRFSGELASLSATVIGLKSEVEQLIESDVANIQRQLNAIRPKIYRAGQNAPPEASSPADAAVEAGESPPAAKEGSGTGPSAGPTIRRVQEASAEGESHWEQLEQIDSQIRQSATKLRKLEAQINSLKRRVDLAQSDLQYDSENVHSVEWELGFLGSLDGEEYREGLVRHARPAQMMESESYPRNDEFLGLAPIASMQVEPGRSANLAIQDRFRELAQQVQDSEKSTNVMLARILALEATTLALQVDNTDLSRRYESVKGRLQQAVDGAREKLKGSETDRRKLEHSLDQRDSDLNQFQINWMLVWAVYGMVICIMFLFYLLKIYPPTLTDLIVQNRVFVEVLSMGFLLVTVIILGAAKLVTGEGLAGLLGTIAGYIFAKKTSEVARPNAPTIDGPLNRSLSDANAELNEAQKSLSLAKADADTDPDNAEKKQKVQQLEAKLNDVTARALSITNAIETVTALRKSSGPSKSDNSYEI